MLSVVAGGAERSDSVAAGVSALPSACRVVLVHDAARPFIDAALIDRVIAENADAAEKFRGGNQSVIGFLVGQVMRASGGSANPTLAQELLRERLSG